MAIKNDTPLSEEERAAAELATKDTPVTDDPALPAADAPADEPAIDAADAPAADAAPVEPPKTPRQRVAERYAEKRKEEIEGTGGTIYDVAAAEEEAVTKPAEEATKPTEDKPAEVVTSADEPIIKLKVHGRDIELPQSEVVKQAQISIATSAAERALADLTRQVQERRAELTQPAPRAATNGDGRPAPRPTEVAPNKPTTLDPARLKEIREDIRNGTDEDADAAFLELINAFKPPPAPQPVDVSRVVDQRLAANKEREAINSAVGKFAEDYPEIASDEDYEVMAYTRAVAEMLDDMEKAGASPQTMAKLRAANVVDVAAKHRALRNYVAPDGSQPYVGSVRSYGEVLKAAGDHVRAKIGRTAPAPQPSPGTTNGLSARTDLKRTLTPQPRTTQHRTQPEAATPPGGKPDPKSAVQRISALRNRGRTMAV